MCRVGDRLADVWKPTHILTEDSALGPALAEHFARKGYRVFQVGTKGRPKADRFQTNLARLKAGDVVLCEPAPWASVFIDEMVRFPYHAFDDQVDALIQLLTWTRENPPPPRDNRIRSWIMSSTASPNARSEEFHASAIAVKAEATTAIVLSCGLNPEERKCLTIIIIPKAVKTIGS